MMTRTQKLSEASTSSNLSATSSSSSGSTDSQRRTPFAPAKIDGGVRGSENQFGVRFTELEDCLGRKLSSDRGKNEPAAMMDIKRYMDLQYGESGKQSSKSKLGGALRELRDRCKLFS